jgi:hypothetical protein
MKDELLIELTNKFIDNELTENELNVLNKLLEDENNKYYFNSLINTLKVVETKSEINRDIDIKNIVMGKIMDKEKKKFKVRIKNYFNELLSGSLSSYAASFGLGGLFIAILFMLLPFGSNSDDSFMKGVMKDNLSEESYYYNDSEIKGEIKIQYPEGIVVLDIDMTSGSIVDCELMFNKEELSVYGIKSLKQEGNKTFYLSGNTIKLNDINSNHYLVFFKRVKYRAGKIDANFYMGHELINSKILEIKN